MPYKVPSTAELIQRDLSNIEYSLNQKTPPAEKAFNAVLAVTEGLADKGLYAFAADLIRENLALTASEEGLTKIGEEYGIYRVQPAIWEGVAIFDIPDGNTLFFGTIFIGPQNIKYQTIEPVTAPFLESGSGVQVSIVCTEA
ncbi:MAG: hypothetical protein LBH43_17925, partial [Treponema sp.]|nr:hypothetical protein [Treponema sp.]